MNGTVLHFHILVFAQEKNICMLAGRIAYLNQAAKIVMCFIIYFFIKKTVTHVILVFLKHKLNTNTLKGLIIIMKNYSLLQINQHACLLKCTVIGSRYGIGFLLLYIQKNKNKQNIVKLPSLSIYFSFQYIILFSVILKDCNVE